VKLTLSYDRRLGRMAITDGAREAVLWHSTALSPEALAELAEAVSLLRAVPTGRCAWAEEPGEYRWVLQRRGDDVAITVRWFPEAFSKQADEQGTVKFSAVCNLRRFAAQMKSLLQEEIDGGGFPGRLPSLACKLDALL
jgi:hypothetical protein